MAHMSSNDKSASQTLIKQHQLKKWTDHEKDKLFNFVLRPDRDSNFALIKVNKGKLFEKALDAFRRVTGGGGDGDQDIGDREGWDWTDGSLLEQQLADAIQKGQVSSGDLSVKLIQQWETKGWCKLFKGRLQDDPKIHREVAINSASDISPQCHPSTMVMRTQKQPQHLALHTLRVFNMPLEPCPQTPQHKTSTHDMMDKMTRFLGDRSALNQKWMDIAQARMDLKVKEADIKARDSKYKMLIKVQDDPNSTAGLKELAEEKLKGMLEAL
ncbi:hypothetical protein K435DRAFT_803889 [Dendrothele bispora CBS 962.96]|uniref:Uncharacterized protein n=1 Tax=Dendrothele bispora (strain CBS 962.96) TaxID=1314807 RepID=A0A4S8LH95_DENBC|nr:hypothetical protein K435DRAFT_803889 [Dendrothele bispora CBS 962.96]